MEIFSLFEWGDAGWGDELAHGVAITVALAFASLPVGLALGLALALVQRQPAGLFARFAAAFAMVFRALPELLTIFLIYFGGQMLLTRMMSYVGMEPVELSGFVAGVIALGLVYAAFASEVFLGAFKGIPAGQREAAYALGLRPLHAFALVILPQLLRLSLPGLSNLWLVLLKETSLVSVIAVSDLARSTAVAVGVTKQPFLFYGVAFAIYWLMSMISLVGVNRVERWSSRGQMAG